MNLPADGIPPAEVAARERLVNDHHALYRFRQVVLLGEVAARQQRNSQHLEVPRRHHVAVDLHVFAAALFIALDVQLLPRAAVEPQRNVVRVSNAHDAGLRFEPLAQPEAELLAVRD